MRARRTAVVVLVVLAVAGGTAAAVATAGEDTAVAAAEPRFDLAAAERTTLVDTETVQGTLGFDGARTQTSRRAGTVTSLPADGTLVGRGQQLYAVDARPASLLLGAVPMYRELSTAADDGPDVEQLERNLAALGYDPGTVDEHFSGRTRESLRQWQDDLGVDDSGVLGLEDVVFLPSAVRVGAASAAVGDSVQPGAALYAATTTERVVTVDLDASRSGLAVEGATATVTLPDGARLDGMIMEVGTAAAPVTAEGVSADATLPLTLSLTDPAAAGDLVSAPVTVALTREQSADVVAVPVTALVALAEGGYAVRVPDAAAASGFALTAVRTGLYAGGRVEITDGLSAGDDVAVPR